MAFSRGQKNGGILQNLAQIQLYMNINWPNNVIIDDDAMHNYKKLNQFLVQLKYTQVILGLKIEWQKEWH